MRGCMISARMRDDLVAADPNDYSASQTLGGQLRAAGSNGVAYSSVRRESGECAGLFYRPRLKCDPGSPS